MLFVISLILFGMLVGYVFKPYERLFRISNLISVLSVYVLLFFMGISTAVRQDLFKHFREIGAVSIILCFAGIMGSILALIPVGIYLKRHRNLLWSYLELKKNNSSEMDQTTEIETKSLKISAKKDSVRVISAEMFYPVIFFVLGFLFSYLFLPEKKPWMESSALYSLYGLIFFTGIGIGKQNAFVLIKKYHIFVVLIPVLAMIGSMVAGYVVSLILPALQGKNAMAITAGMGYYSISAIITGQNLGELVGMIALFSNLLRELITMLFSPLLAKIFGPLSPIGSGGATAMDTTLPFIRKASGNEYAIIGFISGVLLTILVPVVTAFFK